MIAGAAGGAGGRAEQGVGRERDDHTCAGQRGAALEVVADGEQRQRATSR